LIPGLPLACRRLGAPVLKFRSPRHAPKGRPLPCIAPHRELRPRRTAGCPGVGRLGAICCPGATAYLPWHRSGVGKTYAMLRDGRAQRRCGVDVVLAFRERHGPAATASQVDGLEVLARRAATGGRALRSWMSLRLLIAARAWSWSMSWHTPMCLALATRSAGRMSASRDRLRKGSLGPDRPPGSARRPRPRPRPRVRAPSAPMSMTGRAAEPPGRAMQSSCPIALQCDWADNRSVVAWSGHAVA
jgi:hypothetical protein